jgi:hypothetical protein
MAKKKVKKSLAEKEFNKRGYTIVAEPLSGKKLVEKILAAFLEEEALLNRIQKNLKQTRKDRKNALDSFQKVKKKIKRKK